MKNTLIFLLLLTSAAFSQNTVNVNLSGGSSATPNYVTEQKNYYHNELYRNKSLNTSTGAYVTDVTKSITDYLPIEGSTAVKISTTDSTNVTIYGWTYDASLTAISEIRSSTIISTKLSNYTFTTPSNAKYICLYTRYGTDSFHLRLRVQSVNTVSYQSPIRPEQFTGNSDVVRLQAALDFQRFTSSKVELKGKYYLDSAILLSSGTNLFFNGAILEANYNTPLGLVYNRNYRAGFNSANRDIKVSGSGTIQGPTVRVQPYAMFAFINVENFNISGLNFKSRGYGFSILLQQARIGIVNNITFTDGAEYLNHDGIHLLYGCHGITIDDIKGNTNDDLISLVNDVQECGLSPVIQEPYATSIDIYDISISNIKRNLIPFVLANVPQPVYGSGVRLLTADGFKIHDINISRVYGNPQILIQSYNTNYVTLFNNTRNDLYNITVSEVSCPIYIFRPIKNCSFTNIPLKDPSGVYNNASPPDSSINIYRMYNGFVPEFIDSVSAGTEYKRTMN